MPNASSPTEDLPCDFSEFFARPREYSSRQLQVKAPRNAKRNFCAIDATVARGAQNMTQIPWWHRGCIGGGFATSEGVSCTKEEYS
jgi:hypothetical protein